MVTHIKTLLGIQSPVVIGILYVLQFIVAVGLLWALSNEVS